MKTPIAVLASGRGSNFEAILRAVQGGQLDADIRVLVTDNPQAKAIQIAQWAGIAVEVVEPPRSRQAKRDGELLNEPPRITKAPGMQAEDTQELAARRLQHDEAILRALSRHLPKFLVMAGYMRVVTPRLIEAFRSDRGYSRIVNIHPSLLPAFPGVESYAQAFHHGAKITGATVHLVEEQVDSGPICAQTAFDISACRTQAEVEQRGLSIEHRLYPETLSWILPEAFDIEAREFRKIRRHYVRAR